MVSTLDWDARLQISYLVELEVRLIKLCCYNKGCLLLSFIELSVGIKLAILIRGSGSENKS